MTTRRAGIVVIGGGYAGAVAANRLQLNPEVDITLVNSRPHFVQRLRLHQVAAGSGEAVTGYERLLGDRVRLVVDTATRIDTAAATVQLASGSALGYDYLVYAVGSEAGGRSSVPGAHEFAFSVADLESVTRLRAALDERPRGAAVTVVGGGLTGIETAAELAESGHTVRLVCGGALAPSFSRSARESARSWLDRNDVGVRESAVVSGVRPDSVVFTDGSTHSSDITVWAAGFGVPDLATRSGLSTDTMGRLLTDDTLTSVDDERIVGAGDAVAPRGRPLRMSCYAAVPTAATAADTVLSRIAGARPAPLSLAWTATNVGLGRRRALLQLTHADDTPVDLHIGGRVAGLVKEAVTRGTLWAIRREARKPGSLTWRSGTASSQQMVHTPTAGRVP